MSSHLFSVSMSVNATISYLCVYFWALGSALINTLLCHATLNTSSHLC